MLLLSSSSNLNFAWCRCCAAIWQRQHQHGVKEYCWCCCLTAVVTLTLCCADVCCYRIAPMSVRCHIDCVSSGVSMCAMSVWLLKQPLCCAVMLCRCGSDATTAATSCYVCRMCGVVLLLEQQQRQRCVVCAGCCACRNSNAGVVVVVEIVQRRSTSAVLPGERGRAAVVLWKSTEENRTTYLLREASTLLDFFNYSLFILLLVVSESESSESAFSTWR